MPPMTPHPVYIPSGEVRRLRQLLSQRDGLRRDRKRWLVRAKSAVRAAGLSTRVAPDVTLRGDAVYLAMAGVERHLGAGAGLVLTDWETPLGPAADLPRDHPAHMERLDYVTRMLGSDDAYWRALEAGPEGDALSPGEAQALGILTGP